MTEPGLLLKQPYQNNISVVLVQPQQSLNIGSVARAMLNLGYENLVLVKPENFDLQKASVTARWATHILEKAVIKETLPEALAHHTDVVGFGGRYDGVRFDNLSLPEWSQNHFIPENSSIALVFGPEDRGLNTEEINNCRWLVRIPSTSEYPSYNLAQAVLIVLYQITISKAENVIASQETREMPEWNDFYQLDRLLDKVLTSSGFYRKGTPQPIPGVIQNLFHRMNPDKREMGILLAMVSRIARALECE
jgi:TrmH family RNA methyltransferase